MQLQPTKGRVIIRPDKQEEITTGGIIIPGNAKTPPSYGTVVACGKFEGVIQPKAGDRLLFAKYAAQEIEHEGETLKMVRESEVFAIEEGG